jgi:hypothetical protein
VEDLQSLPVLIQLDPTTLGIPTHRYAFLEAMEGETLSDFAVDGPKEKEEFNEINTGNPGALSGFIQWAIADPKKQRDETVLGDCRAKYHALILSGHGSGATGDRFLADESSQDTLTIKELHRALSDARLLVALTGNRSLSASTLKRRLSRVKKEAEDNSRDLPEEFKFNSEKLPEDFKFDPKDFRFNILGLDACFMSMAEVCYQIRNHVDFVVGAEGFEPEFGWPYDRVLEKVADLSGELKEEEEKEVTPEILARAMVEVYVDHYADYEKTAGRAIDLAAIDTSRVEGLVEPVTNLASQLTEALDSRFLREQIVLAHWEAQSFKFQEYVDLKDFCDRLMTRLKKLSRRTPKNQQGLRKEIVGTCSEVDKAVKQCVVLSMCCGWQYQFSYGLSIYFPWASVADRYEDLAFVSKTKWDEFLKSYIEKTCRDKMLEKEEMREGFQKYTRKTRSRRTGTRRAMEYLEEHAGSRHSPRLGRHSPRLGRHSPRMGKFGADADGSMKNFPEGLGRAKMDREEAGDDD